MEQKIKVGDIIRLTDPLDNGTPVRVEMVDGNFFEFIGGGQNSNFEQITCQMSAKKDNPNGGDDFLQFQNLSEVCRYIETKTGVKLYPESAVEYYRHAAEVEAKEHAYYEQAWNKEHNKLLDAQDEIEKLKKEIK